MRASGALVALAVVVGGIGVGCKARTDEFYAKVFDCENNVSDTCGTTRTGNPMTCFAASKLGGNDFCAEACDPAQGSADPHFVCVTSGSSGVLLQKCVPPAGVAQAGDAGADAAGEDDAGEGGDAGAGDAGAGGAGAGDAGAGGGCPAGLSCYRTDLLIDQGVCIKMPVCSKNTDCPENMPVCASTVVQQNTSLPLHVGNLQCVATMCSTGTPCPPGQGCLAGFYDTGHDYDFCVPTCDGRLQCPPNFSCAQSPQSSGAPSLCLPGLPGIRCQKDQDCVLGECLPTGAGFNECVPTFIACKTDLDCASLDGKSRTFLCVEDVPGAGKHCILREEFSGFNCEEPTDCAGGFFCTTIGPFEPMMSHGECRLPCGPDLGCAARGGIPNVSLADGAGGCYPTAFGTPCTGPQDCMPELQCLPVLHDDRTVIDSPTICTMPCTTDAQCLANPLIRSGAFCRQDEHLCRMAGYGGTPCEAGDQCASTTCGDGGTCTN